MASRDFVVNLITEFELDINIENILFLYVLYTTHVCLSIKKASQKVQSYNIRYENALKAILIYTV